MDTLAVRIEGEEVMFRYAVGIHEPREREFHTRHELFFLQAGDVELISDAGRRKVEPNTAVLVPGGTFHQFLFEGEESRYRRCVFKLGQLPELNDLVAQRFRSLRFLQNAQLTRLFAGLTEAALSQRPAQEKQICMKAYLSLILLEIDEETGGDMPASHRLSQITQSTLAYISRDLREDLSLGALAQRLHISASHLSHVFKEDMRISLHKYVLNKRLILADSKLRSGIPAVQTAMECGFRDYSNFCQQYKKAFGHNPSRSSES